MHRGYVILPRSFWDLPIFNQPYREFSAREAWIYLFSNMANGVPRNGLDRGEFQASMNFLAQRWNWSRSKVRRFFIKLQTESMIEKVGQSADGFCYRISNYELYQTIGKPQRVAPKQIKTKADYHKYLAGREWAILKGKIRKRSNGKCERCRIGHHESTHHLTYERVGHELLTDLIGVCSDCHKYLSGESDYDPAGNHQNANKTDQTGILS